MREDDYTGSKIDDGDELSHIEDLGLFELPDDDVDVISSYGDDDNEMLIHVGGAANGAKSLREVAERLYDLADELLAMSGEGWEIVDDITNGYGTAVRFETDELAELGATDG